MRNRRFIAVTETAGGPPAGAPSLLLEAQVAFEAAPVAIALCDLAGRLSCANRAFNELFGLGPGQEATARDLTALLAGQADVRFIEAVARDGIERSARVHLKLREGMDALPLLCHARRIEREPGLACWLGITFIPAAEPPAAVTDDGPWARAEELAGIGHWKLELTEAGTCDVEDLSMQWSAGMRRLFGARAERMPLGRWLSAIVPEDRERVRGQLLRLTRATSVEEIDYRLASRPGRRGRQMSSRIERCEEPPGSGRFVLTGTERDVGERLEIEASLRRRVAALRAVIEGSDTPVCAVDRRLQLLCANRAFREAMETYCGREIAESGRADLRRVLEDARVRRRVIANVRSALRGERRVELTECRDRFGARRQLDLSYTPIAGADGEVIGVAVSGVDVTGRRRAARERDDVSAGES